MYRNLSLILVVLIGLAGWKCTNDPVSSRTPLRELTAGEKKLIEADNSFSFKLFREMVKDQKDANVFISPLSVSMALGMTYNGASGTTQEAMQETLELSGLSLEEINQSYKSLIELLTQLDPQVRFQIANSIWYRQGLPVKTDFISRNKTYFNAEIAALDFSSPEALTTINYWVDQSTNGKINKIVDRINPLHVMFLINAIYFKGNWTYQFDKTKTKDDLFTKPDGSQVGCKMMEQNGDVRFFSNGTFTAVDLPYGDQLYSMTIILPRMEIDFDSLLDSFTQENWSTWMEDFNTREAHLFMPKFKLEYEQKLNNVLKALGMEIAFTTAADFSGICDCDMWIDEVKHKTFVEVNEEGTEAAAATSVVGVTGIPPSICLDRPFIFVIRENHSGTLLFMGRIVEPTWE